MLTYIIYTENTTQLGGLCHGQVDLDTAQVTTEQSQVDQRNTAPTMILTKATPSPCSNAHV